MTALLLTAAMSLSLADEKADPAVPVEELKKGLMAALGESFEFVSGELRWTHPRKHGDRYWLASVRPKKPGKYAFTVTVTFDFPAAYKKKLAQENAKVEKSTSTFSVPLVIGERGGARIVRPNSWGGSGLPHANVGDTVIIPIPVNAVFKEHLFEALPADERLMKIFFDINGETSHKNYLARKTEKPTVRSEAKNCELLASWGVSSVHRALDKETHSLGAYLQFTATGEFNLRGRLTERKDPDDHGVPLRIVAEDKPVTVLIDHIDHRAVTGHASPSAIRFFVAEHFEARIGDRIVMGAGSYVMAVEKKPRLFREGLIEQLPFNPKSSLEPPAKP